MDQNENWRAITFEDIPSREEFKRMTVDLLHRGITNSDRQRDTIRRMMKVFLLPVTGNWNGSPSDKFVNEHAFALKTLKEEKVIKKLSSKEYCLP